MILSQIHYVFIKRKDYLQMRGSECWPTIGINRTRIITSEKQIQDGHWAYGTLTGSQVRQTG